MLAIAGYHRTTLSLLPVFGANLSAVLPRAHPYPERVLVVQLHAVGSGIDVSRVRVPIGQSTARTEITSTVVLVKTQRRELEQVHITSGQPIFKECGGAHLLGRNRLCAFDFPRRHPENFELRFVRRQSQS